MEDRSCGLFELSLSRPAVKVRQVPEDVTDRDEIAKRPDSTKPQDVDYSIWKQPASGEHCDVRFEHFGRGYHARILRVDSDHHLSRKIAQLIVRVRGSMGGDSVHVHFPERWIVRGCVRQSPFTVFVSAQRHLGRFAVITAVKRLEDNRRLSGCG